MSAPVRAHTALARKSSKQRFHLAAQVCGGVWRTGWTLAPGPDAADRRRVGQPWRSGGDGPAIDRWRDSRCGRLALLSQGWPGRQCCQLQGRWWRHGCRRVHGVRRVSDGGDRRDFAADRGPAGPALAANHSDQPEQDAERADPGKYCHAAARRSACVLYLAGRVLGLLRRRQSDRDQLFDLRIGGRRPVRHLDAQGATGGLEGTPDQRGVSHCTFHEQSRQPFGWQPGDILPVHTGHMCSSNQSCGRSVRSHPLQATSRPFQPAGARRRFTSSHVWSRCTDARSLWLLGVGEGHPARSTRLRVIRASDLWTTRGITVCPPAQVAGNSLRFIRLPRN
jgi:hypothetical protein